jgi:hypothetical protein
MRTVVVLLLVLFAASLACAQTPSAAAGPPDFQIVKYSWSKERIGWEKDPFSATVEDFNDMRGRVSRERRPTTALEERSAGAEKAAKARPPAPPRYGFTYNLNVHNAGPKAIKEIDWDYVFVDAGTGEELDRRQFTSVQNIGPGKQKELTFTLSTPPTRRISVYSLDKKERSGIEERVIIVRVKYADGSEWELK